MNSPFHGKTGISQGRLLAFSLSLLVLAGVGFLLFNPGSSGGDDPESIQKLGTEPGSPNGNGAIPSDSNSAEAELIEAEGYRLVQAHCSGCHSLKLVTQNRANREGWKAMIEWMQETQNLWDLGNQEEPILQYLAKHYGPGEFSRRKNLQVDSWYEYRP